MNPREQNKQRDGRNRLHVPQRSGVQLRKSAPEQPSSTPVIPLLDEDKETFSTPLFLRPVIWFGRKLKQSPKRTLAALLVVIIVGYIVIPHPLKEKDSSNKPAATGTVTKLARNETPKFDTVLPAGKTIKDFGGWTRISPPDRVPVYAYADKIGNVTINVSQQELPYNLRDDDGKEMEKLSEGFNADKKLTVGDITAYVGTSAKGPQSVIFAKDELLVLIKSTTKVSDEEWITYISSLE